MTRGNNENNDSCAVRRGLAVHSDQTSVLSVTRRSHCLAAVLTYSHHDAATLLLLRLATEAASTNDELFLTW